MPLVVSNLENSVSVDYFHIGFIDYAVHMVVPDLFAFLASVLMLYLFFGKDIPKSYDPVYLSRPRGGIVHEGMFRAS